MQALRGRQQVRQLQGLLLFACYGLEIGSAQAQQHGIGTTPPASSASCGAAMTSTDAINQMNLACCGDADCATGLPKTCTPSCAHMFRPVWELCASVFPDFHTFAASCEHAVEPATSAPTAQRLPRCPPSPAPPQSGHRRAQKDTQTPVCMLEVELLGSVLFSSGSHVVPTQGDEAIRLGGLSALSYDPVTQDWFCLSDRNALSGAFYRLHLPTVSAGSLTTVADIEFVEAINYHHDQVDAEGLAVCNHGLGQPLYISTEDPPMIASLTREGQATLDAVALPPGLETSNVRHNKQLESLTCDPSGHVLYTATEEPLLSDGPIPTVADGGALRIEAIDLPRSVARAVRRTVRYTLEAGEGNGLADLEAIDHDGAAHQRLLALERAWTAALGNTIRIFIVDLNEGLDVSGCLARNGATLSQCSTEGDAVRHDLPTSLLVWLCQGYGRPHSLGAFVLLVWQVPKRLLLDLATLGLELDNYEAMAFGPQLADGRRTLLLVNDDNFSSHQIGTQFILLALDLDE
jgi:hypothetical protein